MTKEQPSDAPDMIPQLSSTAEVMHERRAILFAATAVVFTAAECANPVFAVPALAAYIGAVLEFRKVPSMNPPKL